MQRLEVSGAVRPIYGLLGVKRLNPVHQISDLKIVTFCCPHSVELPAVT